MVKLNTRVKQLAIWNFERQHGRKPLDYESDIVAFVNDPIELRISVPVNFLYTHWPYKPYFEIGIPSKDVKIGANKISKRICLHFLDDGVEHIGPSKEEWIPTQDEMDMLKKLLQGLNYTSYVASDVETNWRYACYQWNDHQWLFGTDFIENEKAYYRGEFDERFRNNKNYIPSTAPMPDWKV